MAKEFVKITSTDDIEKVLEAEKAGNRVRFDVEDFPEFEKVDVAKMSTNTKLAYQIAQEEVAEKQKESDNEDEFEMLSRIIGSVQSGEASARLEVSHKQRGMAYKYLRPDLVPRYTAPTKGWKIVKDGPERTLANPSGKGPHVIGDKGSPELILVSRPEELNKVEGETRKKRRAEERASVDNRYKSRVESETGHAAIDEDFRGRFTDLETDD